VSGSDNVESIGRSGGESETAKLHCKRDEFFLLIRGDVFMEVPNRRRGVLYATKTAKG
jgi:hypothetical protein